MLRDTRHAQHYDHSKIKCSICGKIISSYGPGYHAHMRMHVRKGEAEISYGDTYKMNSRGEQIPAVYVSYIPVVKEDGHGA